MMDHDQGVHSPEEVGVVVAEVGPEDARYIEILRAALLNQTVGLALINMYHGLKNNFGYKPDQAWNRLSVIWDNSGIAPRKFPGLPKKVREELDKINS